MDAFSLMIWIKKKEEKDNGMFQDLWVIGGFCFEKD